MFCDALGKPLVRVWFFLTVFSDRPAARLYLLALLPVLALSIYSHIRQLSAQSYFSWGISDWLIHYSGGFVRRGLTGEVILMVARPLAIQTEFIAMAICVVSFLGVMGFFIARARTLGEYLCIISPVLLGPALFDPEFLFRKDLFVLLLFILCLKIETGHRALWSRTVWLNCISIVGILSHESYFFVAIPALILVRHVVTGLKSALLPLAFLPSLMSFAAVTWFHGDAAQVLSIADALCSHQSRLPGFSGGDCALYASAAIEALQWSATEALSLTASLLGKFSKGVYVPLAWLLTIGVCATYLIALTGREEHCASAHAASNPSRDFIAFILVYQLICLAPLFVVGWDFGRWILLWTVSSVSMHKLLDKRPGGLPSPLWARKLSAWISLQLPFRPQLWHLVFLGIPSCCWSVQGYLAATPVAQIYAIGNSLPGIVR